MSTETLKRKPTHDQRKSRFQAMNELSDRCAIIAKGLAEPDPGFDRVTTLMACAWNHHGDHQGAFVFTHDQVNAVPKRELHAALVDWAAETKWLGFTKAEWQSAMGRLS